MNLIDFVSDFWQFNDASRHDFLQLWNKFLMSYFKVQSNKSNYQQEKK